MKITYDCEVDALYIRFKDTTVTTKHLEDGIALDNVFCERLWRSVKYENIYLNQYDTVPQLHTGLRAYFDFYNHERPHQSLNYRTPAEEHFVL